MTLTIFGNRKNTKPIVSKTKDEIREQLQEQARLDILVAKSTSSRDDRLYLEPIPKEMFWFFDPPKDNAILEQDDPDIMKLIPVDRLTISIKSDTDAIEPDEREPLIFNVKEYKERRRRLNERLKIAATNGYTTTVDTIENESNPADSNEAESLTENGVEPATTNETDSTTPMDSVDEPSTDNGRTVFMPTIIVPVNTVPLTNGNTVCNVAEETQTTTKNAAVAPKFNAKDIVQEHWYSDNEIFHTSAQITSIKTQEIYAYKSQIIPAFPTLDQITAYNALAERKSAALLINVDFSKAISHLNLPSYSQDSSFEDQWEKSGKAMLIKKLIQSLSEEDKHIVIITSDMDTEVSLYELIRGTFNIECTRINHVLDELWDGEYGVFIKTKTNTAIVSQREKFELEADLIICFDVKLKKDVGAFSNFTKRRGGSSTESTKAPVAWLISIQTGEEKAFDYLTEQEADFNKPGMDKNFKVLSKVDTDKISQDITRLNSVSALNLKSWLVRDGGDKETQYKFKSTVKLPNAVRCGCAKKADSVVPTNAPTCNAFPNPTAVSHENQAVQDDSASDMDLASDNEDASIITATQSLSSNLLEIIDKNLLSLLDIRITEAPNQIEKIDSLSESEKKRLNTIAFEMVEDYNKDLQSLKRQFETTFGELQQKYKDNIKRRLQ